MQDTLRNNIVLIGGGAIVILGLVAWMLFSTDGFKTSPEEGIQTASTTPATTTTATVPPATPPKKKELPPEPVFVMPEGGTPIDEYSFVDSGVVYFKSLVSTSTHLKVPSADPKTFRRLQELSKFPGTDVVRDCGAAPLYTFYVDKTRPYFYQVWRAPEFRTGQVDAMNGASGKDFSVTGATTATDGHFNFQIAYKKATSTCILILNQARI